MCWEIEENIYVQRRSISERCSDIACQEWNFDSLGFLGVHRDKRHRQEVLVWEGGPGNVSKPLRKVRSTDTITAEDTVDPYAVVKIVPTGRFRNEVCISIRVLAFNRKHLCSSESPEVESYLIEMASVIYSEEVDKLYRVWRDEDILGAVFLKGDYWGG